MLTSSCRLVLMQVILLAACASPPASEPIPARAVKPAPGSVAMARTVETRRLEWLLPNPWSGAVRKSLSGEQGMDGNRMYSEASAVYAAADGSSPPFSVVFKLRDGGESVAGAYRQAATWLTQGPLDFGPKTRQVSGHRMLVTETGPTSMTFETLVADRLILTASCANLTESQCDEAVEKIDFDALDKFKP